MPLTFQEATARVSSLENRGWRLGLDRMEEFCRRLGLADYIKSDGKFVHVAGTNGKGSVTAFCQSILAEQGHVTGACYSPFVYTVRERIQLSRSGSDPLVSPEKFAQLVETAWPVAEQMDETDLGGPTEFEFKTAMAFLHWMHEGADCSVVEVGLGGRLDATNVVTPLTSVVTSIGFDHMHILGETLGKIAIEKAGIVKPGRPVVVGDVPDEAFLAIETIAKVNQSPVWKYGRDYALTFGFDGYSVTTPSATYGRLSPGLRGSVQPHNMAVAVAACEAAGLISRPERVAHGVARTSAPGRMQSAMYKGRRFLLDGAHNGESAGALVDSLAGERKITLLTGMLEGHPPGAFYEPLSAVVEEVNFVPIQFHRAVSPFELDQACGFLFPRSRAHAQLEEGLKAALESDADVVLVSGSFYLVGEVGRLIGLG